MLVPQYEIQLSAAEQQALASLQRAGKTPQASGHGVTEQLIRYKRALSRQFSKTICVGSISRSVSKILKAANYRPTCR